MTTKREEFLANKKLHLQLYNEELFLRNKVWVQISKAELDVDARMMPAVLEARKNAVADVKERMKEDISALEALTVQLKKVENYFVTLSYDCNHTEADGTSAIKVQYPYGSSEDAKGKATCSICTVTWD